MKSSTGNGGGESSSMGGIVKKGWFLSGSADKMLGTYYHPCKP